MRVRSAATGNNANLWKAVKNSKNINSETIPRNMTLAGLPVAVDERAQKFAEFFHQKVKNNVELSNINPNSIMENVK